MSLWVKTSLMDVERGESNGPERVETSTWLGQARTEF